MPPPSNPIRMRLGALARLPSLTRACDQPTRTCQVHKPSAHTLQATFGHERYRLCEDYLCRITNREQQVIGGVRLGVELTSGTAYAFKEIARSKEAARARAHLHDEQVLGTQAGSDVAGRVLLRSDSYDMLVLPLMAGDLTALHQTRGRGKAAAMLLGLRATLADLERCHGRGVAHRDIKPANLLHRGTSQSVRLCDFGLARATDATSRGTGTPDHMAPEQHWARIGKISGHHPVPADVWGVGATFLDLWVGNPFVCDDAATRTQMHEAYALWHASTRSCWRWRLPKSRTWRFTKAFGKLPKTVRPLFWAMLHPDATKRITVHEARIAVEALLAFTEDKAHAEAHYHAAAAAQCERWDVRTLAQAPAS